MDLACKKVLVTGADGFIGSHLVEALAGLVVNIGSNSEISIEELMTSIKALMYSDVEFVAEKQRIRPRASEVFRLWCDNTKLKTLTNFEPWCSLEEGLEETIEWFRTKLNKYKVNIYNV
jgi:nucleoside-diphosphate-sugar epimerase